MKTNKEILKIIDIICPNDKHCEFCDLLVENHKGELHCQYEQIATKLLNANYGNVSELEDKIKQIQADLNDYIEDRVVNIENDMNFIEQMGFTPDCSVKYVASYYKKIIDKLPKSCEICKHKGHDICKCCSKKLENFERI